MEGSRHTHCELGFVVTCSVGMRGAAACVWNQKETFTHEAQTGANTPVCMVSQSRSAAGAHSPESHRLTDEAKRLKRIVYFDPL